MFRRGLGWRLCGRGGRGRCRNAGGAWTSVHAAVLTNGLAEDPRSAFMRFLGSPGGLEACPSDAWPRAC